jgi:DNA repair exonuclease SbcCD ATPase subunit
MKLHSLRVEQLRRFRQPFELDGLAPGINVITGPNGAGKSTLVRAIRAAFLERYRSSSVDDLRPEGDSSAGPSIELAFELNGQDCRLQKTFLNRKRCQLQMGRESFDGEDAELKLAELLGFEFPGRGASREEHWGIPGLLWIEQGSGQDINPSVEHAADHLRGALDSSLSEVASSGGDELLDQLHKQRRDYVTQTGKPTGDHAKSLEQEKTLTSELAHLDEQIDRYRQQVDQLATLLAEQRHDDAAQPWLDMREQVKEIRARLEVINRRKQELESERQQLARAADQIQLLRDQLTNFAQQEQQREKREKALRQAGEQLAIAQTAVDTVAARKAVQEQHYQSAREMQRIARDEDRRRAVQQQVEATRHQLATVEAALGRAETTQQQLADLRQRAAAQPISKADLATLRKQSHALRELQIRSDAVATRLRYRLESGRQLQLGDKPLAGEGEALLLVPTVLALPGFGQLEIIPGGDDAAELARQQDELSEAHRTLLRRVGFASLEAAESRFAELEQLQTDIRNAEQSLQHHAPEGVAQLSLQRDRLRATLASAEAELAQLPPAQPNALTMAVADQQVEAANAALREISEALGEHQLAVSRHQADRESAQRELDQLLTDLQKPERSQRQQDLQGRLVSLQAEQAQRERLIDEHQHAIDAEQPQLLEQDVQRLEASANGLQRAYIERKEKIAGLQGQLTQAGAQGIEEKRAELAGQLEQVSRRVAEQKRRVAALDLLIDLLQTKRRELTLRMQAPLQRHLNHYLRLLFPNASVEINEDLTLGRISRQVGSNTESSDLDQQSFGTREQLGLIGRLAYADLLKEAGRPTLIILDDALVHSDEQRLGQMKRVLFDAAQRHQILLFSCHPAVWRDLGVVQRALPG